MEPILVFIGVLALLFFVGNFLRKGGNRKEEAKALQGYQQQFDPAKSVRKLQPIYTKVAGVAYANDDTGVPRQEIIAKARSGETLMLIPDHKNVYDHSAVKVCRLNGEQIGFLDMDLSVEIASRLREGARVDAKIVSIKKVDGKREVHIELQKYSRRPSKG